MFRRGARPLSLHELQHWQDDVDVGAPVDTGAEDEVRAMMAALPVGTRPPRDDEDTVPRALPPRIPQRRGLRAYLRLG